MPDVRKLSIAQMLVLSTAAERPDRMVLPLPTTVRAHGGAQQRLLASLLKAALVEELAVADDALSWRQDQDGQRFALRLTDAGLAAVHPPAEAPAGRAEAPPATEPVMEPAPEPVTEPAPVPTAATAPEPCLEQPQPAAPKAAPTGKLGQVVGALTTDAGATLAELVSLTGWLPHTARAAITGLRKRGYTVSLDERDGRKAYRASMAGSSDGR